MCVRFSRSISRYRRVRYTLFHHEGVQPVTESSGIDQDRVNFRIEGKVASLGVRLQLEETFSALERKDVDEKILPKLKIVSK